MKRVAHVSETPATALLRRHGVAFTEHVYDYSTAVARPSRRDNSACRITR